MIGRFAPTALGAKSRGPETPLEVFSSAVLSSVKNDPPNDKLDGSAHFKISLDSC
jgi:hypothetical protein